MPALEVSGKTTSYFEFWPTWLMYSPVVIQWLFLSLRYRSLTLPLIANPVIPLSGMVGVPKTDLFKAAGEYANSWILPWLEYQVTNESVTDQKQAVLKLLHEVSLPLPLVGKPDIGCRGAGVKLLHTAHDLEAYITRFPVNATIQFQKLADWEAEAGVFYVRAPGQQQGKITSLTLKYMPYVVGDGQSTLGQLIAADPRAGELQHLYKERHAASWSTVIPQGRPYRLVFSASHCRGAVFRDGGTYITDELSQKLDRIFDDIPGFHYGRLDIKFRDIESLMRGEAFAIIEINGASSESIHIWDRDTGLADAIKTLLAQYRTLFSLGDANRRLGFHPPGLRALWDAWRYEIKLVKSYPGSD
ncbi:MAG: D-alanine--D-alanine ligase [Gammaproteobacteria bacterium]|nr:D-alanine--D-alanine ligase [Gammaproteobacteria bacterium]